MIFYPEEDTLSSCRLTISSHLASAVGTEPLAQRLPRRDPELKRRLRGRISLPLRFPQPRVPLPFERVFTREELLRRCEKGELRGGGRGPPVRSQFARGRGGGAGEWGCGADGGAAAGAGGGGGGEDRREGLAVTRSGCLTVFQS